MTPRLYLPDAEWQALASSLLAAAAHPSDPDTEIKMTLAAGNILPECTRSDVEEHDRLNAQSERDRLFRHVNEMMAEQARGYRMVAAAFSSRPPFSGELVIDTDPTTGAAVVRQRD